MIKSIVFSIVIIGTTAGIVIYYIKQLPPVIKKNVETQNVETQTVELEPLPLPLPISTTPPNETNLPDYITVEHATTTTTTEPSLPPRRSISLASFFNYLR